MKPDLKKYFDISSKIVAELRRHNNILAVSLGGSHQLNNKDKYTDIDLYVFSDHLIPISFRDKLATHFKAELSDIGLTYWDDGDEWIHPGSDIEVDLIYWNRKWIEDQMINVLKKYRAGMGYTTCFWHTILYSKVLFDKTGWFENLQKRVKISYPLPLKKSIINKNWPVLRTIIPSYYNQIKKALYRNDIVSVNHRVAAFLASYFDILFAVNEISHPGEKRLIENVLKSCKLIPKGFKDNIASLFNTNPTLGLLNSLDLLIDSLEELLIKEKLLDRG